MTANDDRPTPLDGRPAPDWPAELDTVKGVEYAARCYCQPPALDPTRPRDGQECGRCGVTWIAAARVTPL